MRCLRVGALMAVLGSWLLTGSASAEDGTAALLPFQGTQAAKVRQNVQKGLRARGVQLVSLKQVNAVVKNTKGYATQAARLKATVVVKARVRRSEGRWTADTEVRDEQGERVERIRTSSSTLSRLSGRIVAELMKTGRMPEEPAVSVPEPSPPPPTEPRVVVRPFKGTQSAKIRGAAVRGLRNEPVELYPNRRFTDEARSLGADLRSDRGHVAPAAALAVSGLFEGDVLREDGVWSAYVRLVDGASPKVVTQHYYEADTLAGLTKEVQANIGEDFRKDIKRIGVKSPASVVVAPTGAVSAPAVPDETPVPVIEVETKTPAKRKRRDGGPAIVDIEADFRIVHRTFDYNDDPQGNLRDYTLTAGPGVGLRFQYFPGAHVTSGVGAQFGVDFEWERLFVGESTRADGASFPTESQQFLVDLRWRYPTGRWEPFVVLGYGVHYFEFGVSGPPVPGEDNTPGVPSVKYKFIRFGGGFRVALGKKDTYIIGANIAFRGVLRVGGIGSNVWFPEADANGMDAGLFFGFALPLGFEIRVGGDYRRYWFDLNPVPPPPDPPNIAGGALDQYLSGTVGFAWRR